MRPDLLADLATDLLAAAVESLTPDPDDAQDPRADPPARRLIAHNPGTFAWDCELVAVSLTGLVLETPRPAGVGSRCSVIPAAALVVTLLRCYPTVQGDLGIPDAEAITAASEQLAIDGAALAGGLMAMWAAGTLFPLAAIGCGKVTLGPLDPIGPSGGLAGWRFTVTVRF